ELAEKLPGDARQERGGHEHGAQRQCDRNQRTADLVHGDVSGFGRRHAAFQVAFDVFDHDDGVVDHDADRQHQTEQRQVIQGNAEYIQHGERADQGHRNSDHRNDRGATALQQQEYDADHEKDRDKDRLDHLVYRFADEDGGIVDDLVIDA